MIKTVTLVLVLSFPAYAGTERTLNGKYVTRDYPSGRVETGEGSTWRRMKSGTVYGDGDKKWEYYIPRKEKDEGRKERAENR